MAKTYRDLFTANGTNTTNMRRLFSTFGAAKGYVQKKKYDYEKCEGNQDIGINFRKIHSESLNLSAGFAQESNVDQYSGNYIQRQCDRSDCEKMFNINIHNLPLSVKNIEDLLLSSYDNEGSGNNNKGQNTVKDNKIESLIIDVHSLLLGCNIKESNCNSSKQKNSVKYKQRICHNFPFSAKNSESLPVIIDTINPDDTTTQLTLSIENAGINTDAIATIARLPNKVDKALNSEWEKSTNSVWNKNHEFVNQ